MTRPLVFLSRYGNIFFPSEVGLNVNLIKRIDCLMINDLAQMKETFQRHRFLYADKPPPSYIFINKKLAMKEHDEPKSLFMLYT